MAFVIGDNTKTTYTILGTPKRKYFSPYACVNTFGSLLFSYYREKLACFKVYAKIERFTRTLHYEFISNVDF